MRAISACGNDLVGKGFSLTLAEKQWLHAALSLMGFASDLDGGVGIAEGEVEEVEGDVDDVDGVDDDVALVDVEGKDTLATCQWTMSQVENAI